jgi:Flp pilus assembly secretin CpaC
LQLSVRIASASPAGLEQLSARLAAPPRPGQLQVSSFRPGWNVETGLQELVSAEALQVLSASSLLAGDNRPVAVETSARASASCGVQVHFQPSLVPDGRFRLRVEPQIASAATTRRIETEVVVGDGESFLITGLGLSSVCGPERLFPEAGSPAGRELVVLVTAQLLRPADRQTRTAAVNVPR